MKSTPQRIIKILLVIFFCIVITYKECPAESKASHILILNSYHRGYNWTDEQSDAIYNYIRVHLPSATQDIMYMDWKRHPTQENLDDILSTLKHRYVNKKIDLILTTDDAALIFALKHRQEFLSNAPIIYSGVFEDSAKKYTLDINNVTGVYEAVDPEGTIYAATTINPEYHNIFIIHDSSETSIALEHEILDALKTSQLQPHILTNRPFHELLTQISNLPPKSFILLASYARDVNGLVMQPEKFAEIMSAASNAPIFTMYDHMLGIGVVGGSLLSGALQGLAAGQLGVEVLHQNIPADRLAPISKKTVFYGFEYPQLKRFNLPLDRLPEGSKVIGKPFSFYETYRNIVISVAATFTLLSTLIVFLIINISKRKQSETALRSSENKLRNIFERAPIGILLTNAAGEVLDCNIAMEDIFDVPKKEYIGINIIEVMPEGPQKDSIILALHTGDASSEGLYKSAFNGKEAYLNTRTTRIEPSTYMSIIVDITSRKQAEESLRSSEERFRKLAESSNTIPWEFDITTGSWSYIAPQVERILGYPQTHWINLDFLYDRMRPEDRPLVVSAISNILATGESQTIEYCFHKNDGTAIWIHDEIMVSHGAKGHTILRGLMLDITLRHRSEEQLLRTTNAAESANRAKSEFLANMSHEIRTPLNGILGMLQLLDTTELNNNQKMYLKNAMNSSKRLTDLLSDILDLSRVEAGKVILREDEFDINRQKDAILEVFSLAAKKKGLSFDFKIDSKIPHKILGDETRLRQILFNIVGNALKFTETGFVHVDATLLALRNPSTVQILFSIIDSGVGIPDDLLKNIFEPFTQAEGSYTRQFQGAGLGLSIVRKLVQLMGAELAIDNSQTTGTSIYLSFPFKLPQDSLKSSSQDDTQPEQPLPALRILLVEDDEVSLLSAKIMLEQMNHHVHTAHNGKHALEALDKFYFDIILMDIEMPVMDGIKTTAAIRQSEHLGSKNNIPIIAMTAYAMSGDREKFLTLGMNDYLSKPVDFAVLRKILQKTMGRTRL